MSELSRELLQPEVNELIWKSQHYYLVLARPSYPILEIKKKKSLLVFHSNCQFSFTLKTSLGMSGFIYIQELIIGRKSKHAYEILGIGMSLFSKF